MEDYQYIVKDPNICDGQPIIKGTTLKVEHVVNDILITALTKKILFEDAKKKIIEKFELSEAQIAEAITYYNTYLKKEKSKPQLHYWEKQVILYTKNHYGLYGELKGTLLPIFAAHLYYLNVEHVDTDNIRHMITGIYDKLIDHGVLKQGSLTDVVDDIFKYDQRKAITLPELLQYMLNRFQATATKSLNLLEEPIDEDLKQHAENGTLNEYIKTMHKKK